MTSQSSKEIDRSQSRRWIPIVIGCALFIGVSTMPTPEGMSIFAQRLSAVTILMAAFWLGQPVDIAVTSLIPIAAYPLLGILSAQEVSAAYANHNVFLYLGGFAIAIAIERCGLHRRIALHIISRVGSSPRRIVIGFMLTAAVLSMWISNTATTMMMLPIALALLSTLREAIRSTDPETADANIDQLTIPVLLGIAYASSLGGLSTFVGTPTNVSFVGYWDQTFVTNGYESLSMAEWMASFVPLSILMLIVAALVMTFGLRPLPHAEKFSKLFFRDQLRCLGPASISEKRVFVIFLTTAILWVLRKPILFEEIQLLPDWPSLLVTAASWLKVDLSTLPMMTQDSSVAIAMASLLFFLPGRNKHGQPERLLTWDVAHGALPWGMVLLIGSGFAMAAGFENTGLASWLGERFAQYFQGQSKGILVLGVCTMVTFLTEFTTNVATVNTLQPTLAAMAEQLQIDPRLLLIPAAVSASCAFMLPIATPPNAIIFGSGRVPMSSMIKYGVLLNLIGAVLVTVVTTQLASRIIGF